MSAGLTPLQKKLCNLVQAGLPICVRPFAQIAASLNISEDEVLNEIKSMLADRTIIAMRPVINYRALGRTSTLAAASVPQSKLADVAEAVNSLEGVSHCYLREHEYNFWFTLQADSEHEIDAVLSRLAKRFGIDFHSLPALQVFKLDVNFNVEDEEQATDVSIADIPKADKVELTEAEKLILFKLQQGLEPDSEPYDFLCDDNVTQAAVLAILQDLIAKGVIRRIAGIVNYREIGFVANVLFACQVLPGRIDQCGKALAQLSCISHCYQRKTFPGWPYNLFAMMHGRTDAELGKAMDEFTQINKIDSFAVLPTLKEFKKQPVKYRLI